MLAFHNNPAFKDAVLATVREHREADKLIKGTYWKHGKGCAVGCTLEGVKRAKGVCSISHETHALYATELGIPQILARLEDRLFEQLPNEHSQRWPERFITAIPPGADLALVWPRFVLWLLTEELSQYAKRDQTKITLADVGALYREWCETGKSPASDRWLEARNKAYDAYVACDAREAYDACAFAAYACAYDAYAYAAYAYVVREASYIRQADKLIKLLETAPIEKQVAK